MRSTRSDTETIEMIKNIKVATGVLANLNSVAGSLLDKVALSENLAMRNQVSLEMGETNKSLIHVLTLRLEWRRDLRTPAMTLTVERRIKRSPPLHVDQWRPCHLLITTTQCPVNLDTSVYHFSSASNPTSLSSFRCPGLGRVWETTTDW